MVLSNILVSKKYNFFLVFILCKIDINHILYLTMQTCNKAKKIVIPVEPL